ncbi:hypothetical protein MA04_03920 [Alcanivorax balearicus MACL04]|uniref:Uncharacterized protein n=2 Tax=Alloalcanivorax TaxID=3020832 RepID=A0A9Q3W923_9GAMM|nr:MULTISPECIES: hypothetical protein [Alloalcanivorax]MCE7511398.1 hypothetical protein [Alloalcanivorax xenomutans]MCU5784620.1 hypothetical protein [Alloalcanivorax balearicus MACL04]
MVVQPAQPTQRHSAIAFVLGTVATGLYMGPVFWDSPGADRLPLLWGLTAGYLGLHGVALLITPYRHGVTASWWRWLGYWSAILGSVAILGALLPLIASALDAGVVGDAPTTAFWRGVALTLAGTLLLLTHIELARAGLHFVGLRHRQARQE